MNLDSLQALFLDELRALYAAERQIIEILPRMADAASSPDLRQAFETYLKVTRSQIERLREIFEHFNLEPAEKNNPGMRGLVEESQEIITGRGDPTVKDAALIGAVQRVELYEIAAYTTLREFAYLLNYNEVFQLLSPEETDDNPLDNENLTPHPWIDPWR